jgi:aminoglycoside 3-N-acetyltransferase
MALLKLYLKKQIMKSHYNKADIIKSLSRLPIGSGETLFIHSNIGFFGILDKITDKDTLCQIFFDALMDRVGEHGTIVVPTFTYSFPRNEVFDPNDSNHEMGMFSEWVRKHPNSHRSIDPSYSVVAIGKLSKELTANSPENSFDKESFFGCFLKVNGVVLNFNFDAGSTLLHYIERELNVPYRFDKTFDGYIRQNGKNRFVKNTIYVRFLNSEATAPCFESFSNLAHKEGFFKKQKLGRGNIGCIRATDCKNILVRTLPARPWILTKAENLGVVPDLITESYKNN